MHDTPSPEDDDQPETASAAQARKGRPSWERPGMEPWWITARRSDYTMTEEELRPLKEAFGGDLQRREREAAFTPLQKTRANMKVLTDVVRTDAFNDWVRECLVKLSDPRGWTQARVLYESYLTHARKYGSNDPQRAESVRALASETRWGRMMATRFPNKVRRGKGWHYPVKLKPRRGGA